MPEPRNTLAGGFPIAAGALLGTLVGVAAEQPTIGFLGGLAAGGLAAVVLWLRDRRG